MTTKENLMDIGDLHISLKNKRERETRKRLSS